MFVDRKVAVRCAKEADPPRGPAEGKDRAELRTCGLWVREGAEGRRCRWGAVPGAAEAQDPGGGTAGGVPPSRWVRVR